MSKKLTNLGLTDNLEDVTVEQLKNNETAINMLLHNYRKLENENSMLKQDLNRQSTIERTQYSQLSPFNQYSKSPLIMKNAKGEIMARISNNKYIGNFEKVVKIVKMLPICCQTKKSSEPIENTIFVMATN